MPRPTAPLPPCSRALRGARLLAAGAGALGWLGCTEPEGASRTCGGVRVDRPILVLEGDRREASALGRIDEQGCLDEVPDFALGRDPALVEAHGRFFVLVREEGLVHEIDPDQLALFPPQAASAAGEPPPNPWDLDVDAAGRLWIARYDRPSLGVVGADGGWVGEVDLSSYADADGLPEMVAVRVEGDHAYVALENLDRHGGWTPTQPGRLAVVTTVPPFEVASVIELGGRNPFGRLATMTSEAGGAELGVALPGSFDAIGENDGIVRVDLASGTTTLALPEPVLGGSPTEVVFASTREGYAIVAAPEPGINSTWVVAFDAEAGTVTRIVSDTRSRPASDRGFFHSGLALAGPHLLVGDRTPGKARIQIIERSSGREVGSMTPARGLPISLVALPDGS